MVSVCNGGTLSLTSPHRGSKLLKDKSLEPMGSDCLSFQTDTTILTLFLYLLIKL